VWWTRRRHARVAWVGNPRRPVERAAAVRGAAGQRGDGPHKRNAIQPPSHRSVICHRLARARGDGERGVSVLRLRHGRLFRCCAVPLRAQPLNASRAAAIITHAVWHTLTTATHFHASFRPVGIPHPPRCCIQMASESPCVRCWLQAVRDDSTAWDSLRAAAHRDTTDPKRLCAQLSALDGFSAVQELVNCRDEVSIRRALGGSCFVGSRYGDHESHPISGFLRMFRIVLSMDARHYFGAVCETTWSRLAG